VKHGIQGKQMVLGVTGGIAAYKSIELLRLLRRQEADVRVFMTENAKWFVGPNTFRVLSGNPVCCNLFEAREDVSIRHIDWAEQADAVVIAPATANIIGKIAGGIADDALSTFVLACTCPVMICPSMNTHMYQNTIVQQNLQRLQDAGYTVLAPDSGELACGTTGPGRMPSPEFICDRLIGCMTSKDFQGKRVLVTAGPTEEPLDPVRFISNPSSGKMGYAVARAAEHRGADVVLVSGPTNLEAPANVEMERVRTAREMAAAVKKHYDWCDMVIKAAAVSDYRPETEAEHKIKKTREDLEIRMVRNPDILQQLGARKGKRILVGFAAESQELMANAKKKLAEKNLDMIVGNLIGSPDAGFQSDTNTVTFLYPDREEERITALPKAAIAHILLDRIQSRIT
jgi:phosphopantothenoylcysteine decarboxylase/phosphopantothenate--cysteine ligase